jgi:hypothetical protein
MMTYAVIELFLHVAEHFLRGVGFLFLVFIGLSTRFLLCCVEFVFDIQHIRFYVFQVIAGSAYQSSGRATERGNGEVTCSSLADLKE